jgi:hypothetical protein
MDNTTIVSALITNINARSDANMDAYISFGKLLMSSNIYKVIFIDEFIINQFLDNVTENTVLIPVNKKENYLYKYKHLITNYQLKPNERKDTVEYMFTMCNKTEWVNRAVLMNVFNTPNFVWIDFGIKHVYNGTANSFVAQIEKFKYTHFNKIRIGTIWEINKEYTHHDIYNTIAWYFAGGVFGGDISSLKRFACLMKDKCIQTIQDKQTIMWEVNLWYLIYNENKELFNVYKCDHNNTILINYLV